VTDEVPTLPARDQSEVNTAPLLHIGGPQARLSQVDVAAAVAHIVSSLVPDPAARILLVPPDYTRPEGRAGVVTRLLFEELRAAGGDPWVLPAAGTHTAMKPEQRRTLFGGEIPAGRVLAHSWRQSTVHVGDIGAAEVAAVSHGRMKLAMPVELASVLLTGWDLVISVGQVVPHEVVGMANFTKNLVIGLGGAGTINRTHLLGALCDMEQIMGRVHTPVRAVIDAAFDRFVAPLVPTLWVLTVVEDTPDGVVHRGLFVGRGGPGDSGGAAYRAAAAVAATCNIVVTEPLTTVACWLDPSEFQSTWLANKAIYRTRMALADGAEVLLLAPGVKRFGEDPVVDRLIRRHGYRGTAAVLQALDEDPELANNLGAAAHLIHGSSEGRFHIVYCTDPDSGGLTSAEVEAVGYEWRPLGAQLDGLGVTGATPTGRRVAADGRPFYHISRPALGLWTARH
jgi:nickel-dependent lactate racemase